MLSSVTINCQVTKIVMISGSQLYCNQCLKCHNIAKAFFGQVRSPHHSECHKGHKSLESHLEGGKVNFFGEVMSPHSQLQLLWNRNEFIDVTLAYEDSWVRSQFELSNGQWPYFHHRFLFGHFETLKTSLMHPWLVEITGLESPQGSAG